MKFLEQTINNDLLIKMGFNWHGYENLNIYELKNFYIAHTYKSYEHTNGDLITNFGYFTFRRDELEELLEVLKNTKLDLNMFYEQFNQVWSLRKLGDLLLENKFSNAEIENMFKKLY